MPPRRPNVSAPPFYARNKNKFNFFVPILDGLLAVSVLWGIMAVNISDRSLGSLALITPDGQNTKYIAKRTIQNKSRRVPMVICLASSDPSVEISEKCVRIYPGQEKLIEVSGSSEVSRIKMGGFFPILPQAALFRLFTWMLCSRPCWFPPSGSSPLLPSLSSVCACWSDGTHPACQNSERYPVL